MSKISEAFQFSWYTSINVISKDAWDKCFSNASTYNTYAYQKALEDSGIPGISFHYVLVSKNNIMLAIAVCFEYDLSLDVFINDPLKKCINFIKKFYKNFLTTKAFFVGHLTAVCDHTVGIDSSCNEIERRFLLTELGNQIMRKSKILHAKVTFIKEIPESELPLFHETLGKHFTFVESLPNAKLSLNHNLPYSAQIRKKYRSLRKNRLKQFTNAGLTWEICDDCENFSSIIEHMYLETLSRSKNKFECLNRNYFNNVSKNIPNTFFILIKKDYEVVGFVFNIVEENSLKALYLGYDEKYRGVIYFNILYRLIDEAFLRKKKHLLLGQTSYEAKQALGAVLNKIYVGFYTYNIVTLFILKKMRTFLFPKIKPMIRNVWRANGT